MKMRHEVKSFICPEIPEKIMPTWTLFYECPYCGEHLSDLKELRHHISYSHYEKFDEFEEIYDGGKLLPLSVRPPVSAEAREAPQSPEDPVNKLRQKKPRLKR